MPICSPPRTAFLRDPIRPANDQRLQDWTENGYQRLGFRNRSRELIAALRRKSAASMNNLALRHTSGFSARRPADAQALFGSVPSAL